MKVSMTLGFSYHLSKYQPVNSPEVSYHVDRILFLGRCLMPVTSTSTNQHKHTFYRVDRFSFSND